MVKTNKGDIMVKIQFRAKVVNIGNSIGVIIPISSNLIGLTNGDMVKVNIERDEDED